MQLGLLTASDWQEFSTTFPHATRWLIGRTLLRELLALRRVPGLTAWQRQRLAALERYVAEQEGAPWLQTERVAGQTTPLPRRLRVDAGVGGGSQGERDANHILSIKGIGVAMSTCDTRPRGGAGLMPTPAGHGAMREHPGAGPGGRCPPPAPRGDPAGEALGADQAERPWCGACGPVLVAGHGGATGAAVADAR